MLAGIANAQGARPRGAMTVVLYFKRDAFVFPGAPGSDKAKFSFVHGSPIPSPLDKRLYPKMSFAFSRNDSLNELCKNTLRMIMARPCPWHPSLEYAISRCTACAVCVLPE